MFNVLGGGSSVRAAAQQSHEISGDLKNAKTKRAYWAVKPTGTVVIFVHGLMGEAVGTWSNFEGLLLKSDKCQGCDLVSLKARGEIRKGGTKVRIPHFTPCCGTRRSF
jgi:hypothetical protein